jgi:hypothetical protein
MLYAILSQNPDKNTSFGASDRFCRDLAGDKKRSLGSKNKSNILILNNNNNNFKKYFKA